MEDILNLDIVTGEKIQMLCDHFLGTQKDFNYNPKIKPQVNKQIDINKFNYQFDNKENIFCYTHLINRCKNIKDKLLLFKNPFNLILHNSDGNFEEKDLHLLEIPNIKKIYTQNMNVNHERIIPLPIGIANSMWKHGNLDTFIKIQNEKNEKVNNIYFNFNINTNVKKRKECFQIISKKNIPNVENSDYETYLRKLSTYKYAICPEGNGIDTHRFWECIYLGVVPIVVRNKLVEYFSKKHDILILDSWDELVHK